MFQKFTLQTSNNRGMALVATLVLVLVISSFAIALLSITSSDIRLSSLQEASKETFYIAEAGLDRAIAYLEEKGNPDFEIPDHPFNDENGKPPKLGEGTYTVTINSKPPLGYIIESRGERPWNNATGQISTTIVSEVLLDNFAMFAYFSDLESLPPFISYSGDRSIWFMTDDTIEGRLHSNDRLHIAGRPTFYDKVTSAYRDGKGDLWEAHSKTGANPDFRGKPGYEGGLNRIELPVHKDVTNPENSKSLQRIAAGSESLINNSGPGVYVPNNGTQVTDGIWVKEDVKEMIFATDASSGNSKIIIDQSNIASNQVTTIYTIERDSPIVIGAKTYAEGTLVHDKATNTYKHYPGENSKINGVIFVNGKIKSLQAPSTGGGVKGKYTVASNSDINITGDILYNTRINNEECFDGDDDYPDFYDTLGIVTEENIIIPKKDPYNKDVPSNIEINAIMMALGTSFYFEGWNSNLKGLLKVHGSFIQSQRGPIGSFDEKTGTKKYGYTKQYHFDKRMDIYNPNFGRALPPYFPTTGKYIKLWWEEL